MNASLRWLSDFVDHGLSPTELRDLLTARAATVDALEPVRADLAAFVVARVAAAERHPDSDHLWVTKVDAGGGELIDVVCGAPNVAAGGRYPFARVGTVMPNGLRIERRKIRGQVSSGMLCSARELGLGADHEGIMLLDTEAAPGTPLLQAVPLGDTRLVIDVMPNRPDLLSHRGIAREIAAAVGRPLRAPEIPDAARLAAIAVPRQTESSASTGGIRVTVENPDAAPAYLGVVVRGVRVGPSPGWLVERLAGIGVRSISNVVDVTNYMLHGFGQPMHAFDLATLSGNEVRVRLARAGERLRTLDGVERTLDPSMLVIADATRAQGIAGVIGGADSAVSDTTTDIFLEIASFNPRRIRATRRALGISTDASYRFERLVPVTSPAETVAHAIQLLGAVAGGGGADFAIAEPALVAQAPPPDRELSLRSGYAGRFLGISISAAEIARLLDGVGFRSALGGDDLLVTVPSFRTDVVREIDLIEEVARLYGYDRIPDTLRGVRLGNAPDNPLLAVEDRLREALVGRGFLELRPMPFVSRAAPGAVRVLNPIAQSEGYLRTTLLDTLSRRAEYNLAHAREPHLRLFEVGTVFSARPGAEGAASGRPLEELHIGALAMGARRPPHFTEPNPPAWDEWDAKELGAAVAAAAFPGRAVDLIPAGDGGGGGGAAHSEDGHTTLWQVQVDGATEGRVARLALDRPAWAADAYGVELTLDRVRSEDVAPPGEQAYGAGAEGRAQPREAAGRYAPVPAYPASWVDVTLLVPDTVAAGMVEAVLRDARDPLLEQYQLISEFRGGASRPGKGVSPGG